MSNWFTVGRTTEGFYNNALNEASESELRTILPRPDHFAKHGRCAAAPCVTPCWVPRSGLAASVSFEPHANLLAVDIAFGNHDINSVSEREIGGTSVKVINVKQCPCFTGMPNEDAVRHLPVDNTGKNGSDRID